MLEFASTTELLDDNQFGGSCQLDGRRPYDDGVYVGEYDLWVNCGDEGSALAVVAAQPADGSYLILAEFLAVTDRDWDAIATAVVSFLARVE